MWLGPAGHGDAEAAAWSGDPERAWRSAMEALEDMETESVFYSAAGPRVAARPAADLADGRSPPGSRGHGRDVRDGLDPATLARVEEMLCTDRARASRREPTGRPRRDARPRGRVGLRRSTRWRSGRAGTATPTGRFYVRNRLDDVERAPTARSRSARRAAATAAGRSSASTAPIEPDRVPAPVTSGSIRMRNADIRRLARLMPVGTPVTIR